GLAIVLGGWSAEQGHRVMVSRLSNLCALWHRLETRDTYSAAMVRVLQLIDRDAGFQNRTAAEQLARGIGPEFDVSTRQVNSSVPGIISAWHDTRGEDYDLIHAFEPSALAAACMRGGRIIYSSSETPTARSARWLRAVSSHRNLQIVCTTD